MKKLLLLSLLIHFALPLQTKAQSNDTLAMQWLQTDTVSRSYYTSFNTVNILSNSAIVASRVDSNNSIRLNKYSNTGALVKVKTYTAGIDSRIYETVKDDNDNLYCAASINHINMTIPRMSILKYDKALKLKWERNITSSAYLSAYAGISKLHLDATGNLLAIGTIVDTMAAPVSKELYFVKKYSSTGNLLLTVNISKDTFFLNDIATGLNDEIYICGRVKDSNNKLTFCFIKYNSFGVFQYTKTYSNSTIYKWDNAREIRVDNAGDILVYGTISKNLASPTVAGVQFYLVKYSPSGTKLWQSTYNYPYYDDASASFLEIDINNNVYIGIIYSDNDDEDFTNVIKKFNSSGIKLWEMNFSQFDSAARRMKLNKAGFLFFVVDGDWDITDSPSFFQIDSSGNVLLEDNYRYTNPNIELSIYDFDLNKNNNDVVMVGGIDSASTSLNTPVLIKYAVPPARLTTQKTIQSFSVYPNPAGDFINLNIDDLVNKIEFYNSEGRLVHTITNFDSEPIDISSFKNGLYLIKVFSGSSIFSQRFIKL